MNFMRNFPRAFSLARIIACPLPNAVFLMIATLLAAWTSESMAQPEPQPLAWVTQDNQGQPQIHLYFFWSAKCPHCQEARPLVESLPSEYPWLKLHSLELTEHRNHARLYDAMAQALGQQARSVPAFLFCGTMMVGYDRADSMGALLRENLQTCHQQVMRDQKPGEGSSGDLTTTRQAVPVELPFFGEVRAESLSLPTLTLVLAGLDSFNPCAFFVLLFLLSLLVHARSRSRMLAIGGIFILFSGLIYFVFMAAWLNLFVLVGQLQAVTVIAGTLAVALGLINIKDYVWFKRGVSLSIPEHAKSGLYKHMRGLVSAESFVPMVVGTIALAIAANSYELLCTAGFPMVFTRILTLNELNPEQYYLYLALYNIIYVIPLLVIVVAFAATLGARKLTEREGRILKLLSGLMMVQLGTVLLLAPELLDNLFAALVMILVALIATFLLVRFGTPRDEARARS